ncbi:MAG TPA: LLM class flavin-dependent oxidoreductase, partial [Solirubrobacteraceae bacterium]|nr:LLM class flavin-dependent oxidoreductase [Solirubrobacteraceae bacterium]
DAHGTVVRPRTVQRPRPDVWVGAMSPAGARRAGRFGLPLLCDPLSTITELEALVDIYRATAQDAGHTPRVILMRWGWVGEGLDAWWRHVREALWSYMVEIPRVRASAASADALTLDAAAPERLAVGEARHVGVLLRDWARRLGAERIVIKLQGATGPWGEELRDAVRRYGSDVISASAPALSGPS